MVLTFASLSKAGKEFFFAQHAKQVTCYPLQFPKEKGSIPVCNDLDKLLFISVHVELAQTYVVVCHNICTLP